MAGIEEEMYLPLHVQDVPSRRTSHSRRSTESTPSSTGSIYRLEDDPLAFDQFSSFEGLTPESTPRIETPATEALSIHQDSAPLLDESPTPEPPAEYESDDQTSLLGQVMTMLIFVSTQIYGLLALIAIGGLIFRKDVFGPILSFHAFYGLLLNIVVVKIQFKALPPNGMPYDAGTTFRTYMEATVVEGLIICMYLFLQKE